MPAVHYNRQRALDRSLQFLSLAYEAGALQFGEFTLNSGRVSPYFFNSGSFDDGGKMANLGDQYAVSIMKNGGDDFMLYGPAYKGIPLVIATAISLTSLYGFEIKYAFNRKEEKDHGDGGWHVGAPLEGNVLIVEDVITSGLSIFNAVRLIEEAGANPVAAFISLDRMECADDDSKSAVDAVREKAGIDVYPLANARDLRRFVKDNQRLRQRYGTAVNRYQDKYLA